MLFVEGSWYGIGVLECEIEFIIKVDFIMGLRIDFCFLICLDFFI